MKNDSDYFKRNEHLSFDKLLVPKLTIYEEDCRFEFRSSYGKIQQGQFLPDTSEYKILMHLIENKHTPIDTTQLIPHLKPQRKDADADDKQRVVDVISAIRGKLGKSVIKTTSKGYKVVSDIAWI